MQSEERVYALLPDVEKVLKKTDELTKLICQTDDYQKYQKNLSVLRGHEEVYQKLNEFRKKNMELQLNLGQIQSFEKIEALREEYNMVLMDSVVTDFLTSEQRVCMLMKKIYNHIAENVMLDVSYMDTMR